MEAHSLRYTIASLKDIPAIANLRNAAAQSLTTQYGQGHWSYASSESGVRLGISNTSHILLEWKDTTLIGSFRLAQKKPWAIDASYFTVVRRPLYLLDMAVLPELQRQGIGKQMLEEATRYATHWPAQSIRLDAYDAPAGAGEFYRKCGYHEMGRVTFRNVALIYFEQILSREC